MIDPMSEISFQTVALNSLKVAVQRYLSAEMVYVAHTADLRTMTEYLTDRMVLDLRARVLAEQLPPQQIHHPIRVEVDDPRHATWWEFFKATYHQRWWLRWRSWPIRHVNTPVAVQRTITVDVRNHWTFPRASIIPPDSGLGTPVMVATWTTEDRWR